MDFVLVKRLLSALEKQKVRYAVFGGAALNLHGLARFTDDLDLFVEPDADNIERLKLALATVFDDESIEEISADDLMGEYPAVQYVPPEGTFHIDILTRLGEGFRFSDLEVDRLPFEELAVSVVTPQTLYRMKKDTVRLQDRADAAMLRERFSLEDE
ncbi:MAG TPA: nucleotidyl transferase AbiEii/AbiGii toxin family protein [Thermoanaerobaculia bacterium]|nr:nucleotidyl transferase AbiEii/AbiGii toxin family protein [Thermoanaerobaculia bacterium]